ncbi:hypothetical protein K6Q96_21140 [Grimontia kaedaensis]|uniref:C2H2-type domain-containing protein n=1 Tax=Grimontia kaedaensis TaxID=2872157 RepID=A0ABY4WZ54_9GAMM|nr:hypothetical protein [Grimontia kaedaensis]USH04255.1 hypothetical protein K6Q96_21140 [Grimontia kaedaensis]
MDNVEYQLYCCNCRRITRHKRQVLGENHQIQKAKSGFITVAKRFFNLCFGQPLEKGILEKSEYTCAICGEVFDKSTDIPDFACHDD